MGVILFESPLFQSMLFLRFNRDMLSRLHTRYGKPKRVAGQRRNGVLGGARHNQFVTAFGVPALEIYRLAKLPGAGFLGPPWGTIQLVLCGRGYAGREVTKPAPSGFPCL